MRPVPQPAKAICADRGIRNTELAAQLDVSAHHVGRVLNGWVQPSDRLRARFEAVLELRADDLFRPAHGDGPGEDVLALLERTRARKGLTLVIDDPDVIAKIATIVASGGDAA